MSASFEAGDRVQLKNQPNPQKGLVLQCYAAGSRLALVRWDCDPEQAESVEKVKLWRSLPQR
jgi:hypothetical protein